MNSVLSVKNTRKSAVVLILTAIFGVSNSGGIVGVDCFVPPQHAAVQIFEYLEDPDFQINSEDAYRAVFSSRLLSSSSNSSVNSALRSARSTYQSGRNETPLSRRLAAPPVLLTRDSSSFNQRGEVTVRILSLSSRGRIEQRMSLTCESGLWKAESFSYGPPEEIGSIKK